MNDITKNSIIFFLHRSTFFLIIFPLIISYKSNGFLIILLNILFTYILIKLINKSKKYNISKYIINIILILFVIYILNQLVSFIHIKYLINTNQLYIYLLIILTTTYISFKSIDTICKTSFILFIISIIMFLIQSTQLITNIDIHNIIFNKLTNTNFILESIKVSFISVIPFLLIDDTKKIRYYYLISSTTIIITSLLVFSLIGYNISNIYKYPIYQLVSNVNIFGFITRLEGLFSLTWITDIIICISLCLYYIRNKVHIIHKNHTLQ